MLEIQTADGVAHCTQDYLGKILIIAFVKRDCNGGFIMDYFERLLPAWQADGVQPLVSILDMSPGEAVPVFKYANYPIGATPRRKAADFLGVPMTGMHLPQVLFIDKQGTKVGHFTVDDDFCRNLTTNVPPFLATLLERGHV